MDVNGNDNTPEWGYCTAPECKVPAYPIWFAGSYPDDPDLLLCDIHIGACIARQAHALHAAYHALQSYACGNSAPDLAKELAEMIEATMQGSGRIVDLMAVHAAALHLLNVLTTLRYPDDGALRVLGGVPLARDYQALKQALGKAREE